MDLKAAYIMCSPVFKNLPQLTFEPANIELLVAILLGYLYGTLCNLFSAFYCVSELLSANYVMASAILNIFILLFKRSYLRRTSTVLLGKIQPVTSSLRPYLIRKQHTQVVVSYFSSFSISHSVHCTAKKTPILRLEAFTILQLEQAHF